MNAMNFYPEQLQQIVGMLEALNRVEGVPEPETGMGLFVSSGFPLETEDGFICGYLVDEVGGAWSFRPCELKEKKGDE